MFHDIVDIHRRNILYIRRWSMCLFIWSRWMVFCSLCIIRPCSCNRWWKVGSGMICRDSGFSDNRCICRKCYVRCSVGRMGSICCRWWVGSFMCNECSLFMWTINSFRWRRIPLRLVWRVGYIQHIFRLLMNTFRNRWSHIFAVVGS